MITTQTLYGLQCDQCKVKFGDEDDQGESVFSTIKEIIDTAVSCEWVVRKNGSAICVDCQNIEFEIDQDN
jgi:hypothetical protein